MELRLKKMSFGEESRIVFATSPSTESVKTLIMGGAKQILISYWFIGRRRHDLTVKLLSKLRRNTDKVFIDSGVFSLYREMGFPKGKLYLYSDEVIHEAQGRGIARKKEFAKYVDAYADWLNRYDRFFDWAFDVDVDQVSSVQLADMLYRRLAKRLKHPEKIIRVWHWTRKFSDWKAWCSGGEYKYLAIEGGGPQNRDPRFYNRFIDCAHEHGVKVHVLAMTSVSFLRTVPCDTADSSSWLGGGTTGDIYTPGMKIAFGHSLKKQEDSHAWAKLRQVDKDRALKWMATVGLETITEEMLKSDKRIGRISRNLVNLAYYRSEGNRQAVHPIRKQSYLDELFE
jgi:hypothetical protein